MPACIYIGWMWPYFCFPSDFESHGVSATYCSAYSHVIFSTQHAPHTQTYIIYRLFNYLLAPYWWLRIHSIIQLHRTFHDLCKSFHLLEWLLMYWLIQEPWYRSGVMYLWLSLVEGKSFQNSVNLRYIKLLHAPSKHTVRKTRNIFLAYFAERSCAK